LRFGTYGFVSDYGCPHPGMPLCRKQSRRSRDAPIWSKLNIALGGAKNWIDYTPRMGDRPMYTRPTRAIGLTTLISVLRKELEMILGMSTTLFTQIHVAISLIAIAFGLVMALCMMMGKLPPKVVALFLLMTVLTSVTGFFFPFHGVTPGIVVGILSLVVLAFASLAYYGKHLAGSWRRTYVITATFALYLNVFVLVAQSFQKIPSLHALAPTGTETPFKVSQLVVLVVFIAVAVIADKKFRLPNPS